MNEGQNDTHHNLLNLTPAEYELIIEGVDALKTKDFAGEMMGIMFSGLLRPREGASPEEIQKYEESRLKEAAEREVKEQKKREFQGRVDVLKAKLVLIRDVKEAIYIRETAKKLDSGSVA